MGSGRSPLILIGFTVLIDVMGFGLLIPVMPGLVSELGNVPINEAARVGGILIMIYALAQFLFAPVIGGLSDAYGRRPVLLISLAGFAASALIGWAAQSVTMLAIGRIFNGISGASHTTAAAYIADVAPPEKRAEAFGIVGVAFGLGFIAGPALGGLLGGIDLRLPFLCAAALAFANMLLTLFILPESLPPEKRRPFDWRRANMLGTFRQLGQLSGPLRWLALAYFLWMLSLQTLHGLWPFIAEWRYDWTPTDVGLSLTVIGVLAVIVNGGLVKRAVAALGEWRTGVVGLSAGILGYLVHVIATIPWIGYAALVIGSLGGLTVPAIQALMTSQMEPDRQGELQGGLATLSSLTVIIGPIAFSQMFSAVTSTGSHPLAAGTPFLVSILLAFGALLCLRGGRNRPPSAKHAPHAAEQAPARTG